MTVNCPFNSFGWHQIGPWKRELSERRCQEPQTLWSFQLVRITWQWNRSPSCSETVPPLRNLFHFGVHSNLLYGHCCREHPLYWQRSFWSLNHGSSHSKLGHVHPLWWVISFCRYGQVRNHPCSWTFLDIQEEFQQSYPRILPRKWSRFGCCSVNWCHLPSSSYWLSQNHWPWPRHLQNNIKKRVTHFHGQEIRQLQKLLQNRRSITERERNKESGGRSSK